LCVSQTAIIRMILVVRLVLLLAFEVQGFLSRRLTLAFEVQGFLSRSVFYRGRMDYPPQTLFRRIDLMT
jgi:hypothetical protein